MLAKRVIPTLLCRGRQLIKGQQFNGWRSCGLALQAARIHALRGVDELCILDIGATPEGRGPDLKLVEELSADMFTPLAVGGGVRTAQDVDALLRAGADKVVIETAAFAGASPWLITELARRFGRQAIVVSISSREGKHTIKCGQIDTPTPAIQAARAAEYLGAGEIMMTSIDREGMMQGYDLDLIRAVSEAVSVPVIANGGCGCPQHMLDAINAGADAVAAGAMFQFQEITPSDAARYLHEHGIRVRITDEGVA